jgi:hypothetical protein
MNNFIGILVGLILTTAQSNQEAHVNGAQTSIQESTIPDYKQGGHMIDGDPNCRTPELQPEHTAAIIKDTQTMDLNFVALADAESGLYNLSKKKISSTSSTYYRGIFQVNDHFHKMDDYCDPAEQVRWLEKKLREGAKPERLFPSLYKKLYQ